MGDIRIPATWTVIAYRGIGEPDWRDKAGAPLSAIDAEVERAMGRALLRPRTAGTVEMLEVRAR